MAEDAGLYGVDDYALLFWLNFNEFYMNIMCLVIVDDWYWWNFSGDTC